MASVVEILARLKADSSQFIAEMAKAQEATNRLEKSATKTSDILGKKLKVGLLAAGTAAGFFAGKLLRDSVRAATEAGAAQDRLARLLHNTNGANAEGIKILNQQAKALEASTVVTESNITTVQSQLATFDLHGRTIAELTPAILDYVVAEKGAAASADQYRQMTNGLAQALNGQFASLTAVGFVLDAETKKKIKSGTESERAAAIVQVLNSTYKDFAKTAGGTAAGAQVKLSNSINNVKQAFGQALLPVMQKMQMFISSTLVPIIENLQAKFGNTESIEKFMTFIGGLLASLRTFGEAVISVLEPVFTGFLIPAFKLAVGAVIGFIKVLGVVGSFVKKYAVIFTMLVVGIGSYIVVTKLAVLATLGFNKALLIVKKAQQAYAFWTYTTTGATKGFAGAMNLLKTAFLTNPIGIIIAAVLALGVGFKMLWDRSETFRKMIIAVGKVGLKVVGFLIRVVGFLAEAFANIVAGPAKLFLKVLGFINPDAKKAYEGLKNMTNNVGKFFDDNAKKVEDYANTLDKYAKITKKTKDEVTKPSAPAMPDLSKLGESMKGAVIDPKETKKLQDAAKKLAEMKRNLKEAVEKYNEYIKGDFATSFENGAEAARDAVGKALDNLTSVFEAKAKMLKSQKAIDKLFKVLDGVKKKIAPLVEEYAKVSAKIEEVNEKIKKALTDLENAIEERAEAQASIAQLLATPFGEPSELRKAMAGAEASVDSIISSYDKIKALVTKRFTEMPDEGRDMLLRYFEAQTVGLIELAKRRQKAVKVLEKAQADLQSLVDEQQGFSADLNKSLKSFALALIDISKKDSAAVYTVTKTATGLVISQTKQSTNAVDMITKNLQAKLANIVSFSSNINKLLASGLNQEYIRQLLGAGPEAAGETAAALALAGTEQIATINKLYKDINATASQFSTDMGDKFYKSAIGMAENFALGATLGLELIDAVMNDITTNISNVLSILGNTGFTNAKALVDALTAEFTRQANETVGPATQLIVNKIRTTIEALKPMSLLNAQAFMDGLIATLSGEDNRARYTASADQIRANIDTIMKLLAPQALTSGLGLIASLVSAFGGTNLESIKNAAVAIKDSISTALDLLKGKGTQVAKDLAQELYDQLLAEKARLVALAQSIAAAIAAAMASAAASIGVDVDVPEFDGGGGFDVAAVRKGEEKDRDGDKSTASASKAASAAASAAKATKSAVSKSTAASQKVIAVTKAGVATSKTQLQLAKESVNKAKNQGANLVKSTSMPNFRPEATKAVAVGPSAPRGLMRQPVIAPKMTGSNTVSKANMPFGGQSVANVTINTKSVPTASQTKAVVGATLKAATSARKGK